MRQGSLHESLFQKIHEIKGFEAANHLKPVEKQETFEYNAFGGRCLGAYLRKSSESWKTDNHVRHQYRFARAGNPAEHG